MFFKFKAFQGPARYVWKDPDTGRDFEENSKAELISRIAAYRKQNNLEDVEQLSVVLESYWCTLSENQGKCVRADLERGFLGYLKGGVALVKMMLYKSYASQMTADKRSEQCAGCKFNQFPDRGAFVAWSDEIAVASIGDRKSKHHDELGECSVCLCPLRSKVFYGSTIDIEPDWIEPMKEVSCWQLLMDPKKKEKGLV